MVFGRLVIKKGRKWASLFIILLPIYIRAQISEYLFPTTISIFTSFYGDNLVRDSVFKNASYIKSFSILGRGEVAFTLISFYKVIDFFNKNNLSFVKRSFLAFAMAGSTSVCLKYVFHRTRPNTGQNVFYGPSLSNKNVSFPSGHTQIAFTMAGVFSEKYGHSASFYALASLVGASRIAKNMHYLSDVVMGAYTGYMISKLAFGEIPSPKIYIYSKYLEKEIRFVYFLNGKN